MFRILRPTWERMAGILMLLSMNKCWVLDVVSPKQQLEVSVRHNQINAVIDHFKSQGKKILLILHARHFQQVQLKLKYGDNFDQRSN